MKPTKEFQKWASKHLPRKTITEVIPRACCVYPESFVVPVEDRIRHCRGLARDHFETSSWGQPDSFKCKVGEFATLVYAVDAHSGLWYQLPPCKIKLMGKK